MANEPTIDANDSPWPRKSDRFFESADDWDHNACVNWLLDGWDLYAVGYKRAGDILVNHIVDTHLEQDMLVFPIVFNYRQYIELQSKQLIRLGRRLLDKYEPFPRTHNLQALWSICRALISEIEPSGSEADLEAVDDAIAQFCSVDPSSEGFRYPVSRDGGPSLPDALRIINLRQLRDAIDRLAAFLDAISTMFSVYLEYKYEMERSF
jgi:hypothetical protein